MVKHGIGQSLMHTLSGDYDFVYLLFQDENKDKKIAKSQTQESEAVVIKRMWDDFNVMIKIV